MGEGIFRYYFEIHSGKAYCFYNKIGVTRDLSDRYSFSIRPGFHTPDWAKGAVMYQIMVDRFYNGDPRNDVLNMEYSYINEGVVRVMDWNKRPASMGVREFYGGGWMKEPGKVITCCNDGLRPVYFKLEATDREAGPFLGMD
jgi:alpha-glucosidase